MPLQDLLQGLKMFNEGLRDYAISTGVNDAKEKLQQLNAQEMDRSKKLDAQAAVANDLALRLTQAGADTSTIATLSSQLAPSAGAMFQAEENKALQKSSQDFQAKEALLERQSRESIAEAELKRKELERVGKFDEKQVKFLELYQQRFNKAADKSITFLKNINNAEGALKSRNPIADKSLPSFLARASGEVGALTEADKAPFGGSQAIIDRVEQIKEDLKAGVLTKQNRKYVTQLIEVYKKTNTENVMMERERIADQAIQVAEVGGYGLDRDKIAQSLYFIKPEAKSTESPTTTTTNTSAAQPSIPGITTTPEQPQGFDLRMSLKSRKK